MQISAIPRAQPSTDSTNSSTTDSSTSSTLPTQTLTQDDFLKLVVAQMTSQDPLHPQSDTEFIAQMAQFSALEQAKTTQSDMAQLTASQLLGQTVDLEVNGTPSAHGVVSAIQIESGTPKLIVGGEPYDLSQLINIAPTPTTPTTPSPTTPAPTTHNNP